MANVSVPLFPDRGFDHSRGRSPAHRPIPTHWRDDPRPFSMDPVYDLVLKRDPDYLMNGKMYAGSVAIIARRTGTDRQNIYRWNARGIDAYQADAIAVRLGLHPVVIWPDWFTYAPTEAEVAASEAPRVVKPHRVTIPTEVLARAFQLRQLGMSWPRVSKALADEGHTSPLTGRPWDRSTLSKFGRAGQLGDEEAA
jgi:hypothetical protein